MKNVLNIILLVLLTNSLAMSQENFIPGEIVNAEGDTIKGFVDYRNWKNSPKNISYKVNLGDESSKSILSSDFAQVIVNGEHYFGAIVDVEISRFMNLKDADTDSKFQIQQDTVWLKVLYAGPKNLYQYINESGREFYYIGEYKNPELLLYKEYKIIAGVVRPGSGIEEKDFKKEKKTFTGQLSLYLDDCSLIRNRFSELNYGLKDLLLIFKKYYECVSSEYSYNQLDDRPVFLFGLSGGLSLNKVTMTSSSSEFNYITLNSPYFSNGLVVGAFLDIVLPRANRKWIIQNGLYLSNVGVKGYYKDELSLYQTQIYEFDSEFSYLKFNHNLKYEYPLAYGKYLWQVSFGIAENILIQENDYLLITNILNSTESTKEITVFDGASKFEASVVLGTGVRYKNILVDYKFEYGTGMSSLLKLKARTFRNQIMLSYRFGKL